MLRAERLFCLVAADEEWGIEPLPLRRRWRSSPDKALGTVDLRFTEYKLLKKLSAGRQRWQDPSMKCMSRKQEPPIT